MNFQGTELIRLANLHPELKFNPSTNEIIGKLSFCAGFDGGLGKLLIGEDETARSLSTFLCDSFKIRIAISTLDLFGRPQVFLCGDRVKRIAEIQSVSTLDLHFYANGACCLGIKYVSDRNRTLESFLNELLIPFLYRVSFIEKRGIDAAKRELWNEYSHSEEGLQEYESEINELAEQNLGRNVPCPCGGGRKYKQCHFGEVMAVKKVQAQRRSKAAENPC